LHPEFTYLPRKFKIAITGATNDRAAIRFHDIGIRMVRNETGEPGFQIWVGGGLGRTPIVGKIVRDFLPKLDLLSYLESILRVYNRYGRRDNKYKARIKILVNEIGLETFRDQVEEEWRSSHGFAPELPYGEIERIMDYFDPPSYKDVPSATATLQAYGKENPEFARFLANNVMTHKQEGYAAITISLKPVGGIPGDASAAQMNAVAAIADQYGFGEIRVTHEQNLVLPDIAQQDLIAVFEALQQHDLAIANVGEATDMICCPGLDYCNLANARSIPIAQDIAKHLNDKGLDKDAGKLTINISGCINACGHHHVANIGILGVDKRGAESYQVTLGGAPDEDAAVGKLIGPGFSADDIVPAIDTIVSVYTQQRQTNETFLQTYRRIGAAPFKEALYD
jgi:sulfite reductase (NADPH) hemoprotein beta-component